MPRTGKRAGLRSCNRSRDFSRCQERRRQRSGRSWSTRTRTLRQVRAADSILDYAAKAIDLEASKPALTRWRQQLAKAEPAV